MDVGFFIFPTFQLLDLSGPLSAFEIAQRYHGAANYRLHVVSLEGGFIESSGGLAVASDRLEDRVYDTLYIIGSDEMDTVCSCSETRRALLAVSSSARRMVCICTGAFLLAETGLLEGRKVTTHWRFAEALKRKQPGLKVEFDRIYLKDGSFWTSAGITAGIDLSLALIREDFGEDVSKKVAQDLVVFHRRPGGQSQYSALLSKSGESDRIARTLSYAREHLDEDLSLDVLAANVSLSPRQFARVFKSETGTTPAKAVEALRVEAARIRVEANFSESLEEISDSVGFKDLERMRRSFVRVLGQGPQALRRAIRG
ncbi:DJ-1/PfpI family [Verrucomicrobiia bacterium DG1235]|nr:DJ-1/PfpI family [Verrucomicrobiae bacterium DG1235]